MGQLKMGFRWFGEKDDNIKLSQVRQIPQTKQVVGALFDVPVGEVWPQDKINALKKQVTDAGLKLEVIESVNIHDDIKIGLPSRDKYIENYIQTIKNLSKVGVKVICYNFMPVFDWLRTDLHHQLADGSNVMMYEQDKLPKDPEELMTHMKSGSNGFSLPGWEPERLAALQDLFDAYKDVDEEKLRENLKYFFDAIIPVCEKYDVRMAMHPDDPPKPLFGLPRIFKNRDDMLQIEKLHESRYNGFTICTGSLGENPANDLPAIIREFVPKDRVPFMHVRNIKFVNKQGDFHESAHPSSEGSLDMYEIMKALHDTDYDGYIRPDHGRNIWGEDGRPGYGLYDRALGITYLLGLWEALEKNN
ncbi:mannonate dehydratase [Lentilactobacillus kefiri]|nr:mannonate dehydratase [Lentilactobacillus kefiri]MCJ2162457.1 mannonate dehydratase [Lentilactobacillus kefiri]MCP9369624.1 mannonate dehydratase [Lentilactobacillus kefiri]MDH5109316.1 mannonate dehydratase [Lentilactobacillus kefiri]MDM7493545.1 mannonate dehydratase [Lentilactobacillus kefiri]PAK58929.1 mannonate dehydratase [Lentilactobacillus kefiri]